MSPPFWLMMASSATAVLPVWRSPMMSSRCPAPDRHHRVDGLQPRLHRLAHGLAGDHAGRHLLDRRGAVRLDRPLAVDGLTERVHHPAEQRPPHRYLEDAPGALDGIALGDVAVVAHDDRADGVAFEIERESVGIVRKLDHLALHHVGQAVDAGDAVGEGDDRPFRAGLDAHVEALDLLLDEVADFRRGELHVWNLCLCLPSYLVTLQRRGFARALLVHPHPPPFATCRRGREHTPLPFVRSCACPELSCREAK